MDYYNLGFHQRHSKGMSLGAQELIYKKSIDLHKSTQVQTRSNHASKESHPKEEQKLPDKTPVNGSSEKVSSVTQKNTISEPEEGKRSTATSNEKVPIEDVSKSTDEPAGKRQKTDHKEDGKERVVVAEESGNDEKQSAPKGKAPVVHPTSNDSTPKQGRETGSDDSKREPSTPKSKGEQKRKGSKVQFESGITGSQS